MSLSSDGTVMTMPVTPAYAGGYGNGMWGGDSALATSPAAALLRPALTSSAALTTSP